MTPIEFLKSVWPIDGLYCIAIPMAKGYAHHVFKTIEEAAAYVENMKDAKDIFFCVHSLQKEKVWNPNKGNEGGWSVRLQTNMRESRTFFFDLDVGEGDKKYASQAEAVQALKKFIVDTKLPYPMVTSSGGGLHVYWTLDTSILSNEWMTYAERLKQVAQAFGLKADPARTTDTASVLRVVGTFNHKKNEKRPVRALKPGQVTELDTFLKLLNDAVIRAGVTPKALAKTAPDDADKYFGASNMDRQEEFDPVSFKAVLKICPQARYLAKQAGDVSEPEWQASLNMVRFCVNGEKLIHKISMNYAGYDHDATEAKVQRLIDYRSPKTGKPMGPTTCKKLSAVCGPERCVGCAYNGSESSPLWHARKVDSAPAPVIQIAAGPTVVEVEIPPPPRPYVRMKSGGVSMKDTNSDGEEFYQTLYEHDLYPVSRIRNEIAGMEQLVWRVTLPKDGVVEFVLEADALYDRKKFVTVLANAGVYPHPDNVKGLQNYMVAYVAELQRRAAADAQCNHLGWADDKTAFILPDKIIYRSGEIKPVTLSGAAATYAEPIHKKGTLERQLEILSFYNDPVYIRSQFAILASLAAPLFGMTGQHGVIVNCTGETGASKSSTILAAASIWGHPEKYTINGTKDGATARHRNAKIMTLANLPICVDEITTIGLDEAHNMAMGISQSEPRGRLNRDGTPQKQPNVDKSTIVLTSSNNSLHGLLSTNNSSGTAASMRVFEIQFPKTFVHQKWEADNFLHEMMGNYGHIGEVYMQHVVPHYEAIQQMVRAEMKQLDIDGNITSGERFWSSTGAPVVIAARLSNQLGLLQFDEAAVRHWLLHVQLPAMRGVVSNEYSSPIGVLTDYLEMISGNTLVVSRLPGTGIVNILKKPNNQLLAHFDYEDKTLWVLRKGFKDHCAKIGANFLKIIDDLHIPDLDAQGRRIRVISNRNIKKVLGSGTEFGKAQAWCFVVDLKHPDCLGTLDLAVVENPSVEVTPPKGKLKIVDGGE